MAALDRILAASVTAMADATAALEHGTMTRQAWEREMERLLMRYHTASWLAGSAQRLNVPLNSPLLSERRLSRAERGDITREVRDQIKYLSAFSGDIRAAEEWTRRFNARAAMYGASPKVSYWRGRTSGMDLPGHPGDGSTPCLSNCACAWRLEGQKAYWELSAAEHCTGCREREAKWSPYTMQEAV